MNVQTSKEFRAWLERRDPDTIVGERADMHSCPVAEFIKRAAGREDVLVTGRGVISLDGQDVEAPSWVDTFVQAIDEGEHSEIEITAAEALATLDGLP